MPNDFLPFPRPTIEATHNHTPGSDRGSGPAEKHGQVRMPQTRQCSFSPVQNKAPAQPGINDVNRRLNDMEKILKCSSGLRAIFACLAIGSGTALAGGLVDTGADAFASAVFAADSEDITNPWWTLSAHDNYLYFAETEDECEWNLMEVMGSYEHNFDAPYSGVEARIILDRAWVDEECAFEGTAEGFAAFMETDPDAAETTYDWFAQDTGGNIWYLGEDTYDGDKSGSFVAGCDGAEGGIVVQAVSSKGEFYQQEFYEDEAEDWGKVLNFVLLDDDVCMKTKEWTPLEPGHVEHKFYCMDDGAGEGLLTLINELKEKTVTVELVDVDVTPPGQEVIDRIASEPVCPLVE
jgi:hypothetical protein